MLQDLSQTWDSEGKYLRKARFVRCDVRSWEEQVCLFEAAVANSPRLSCDIVIANAGIPGPDGLFAGEGRDTFHFFYPTIWTLHCSTVALLQKVAT